MQDVNRILVAIDRSDRADLVLEKAVLLANAADAELEVVRVIYEGTVDLSVHDVEQSQALKTFVMQAEESYLEDLIEPYRNKAKGLVCLTLWHKDTWQGIVDAADDYRADLIIKAANMDDDERTVQHTPQDWNLLRHSHMPVMMVKPDAWVSSPNIFAAIDAVNEDQAPLNIKILKEAAHLTSVLGGALHIITAYPMTEPWSQPSPTDYNFQKIRTEVEEMVNQRVSEQIASAGISYKYLYIEEGKPAMAIEQMMDNTAAEILVMGTVAREGLRGIVIGNTSETILHNTNCDVVVLR